MPVSKWREELKRKTLNTFLLEHDINARDDDAHGMTPLMVAAECSNSLCSEHTVKRLLDKGADINLRDKRGMTALMLALAVHGCHTQPTSGI